MAGVGDCFVYSYSRLCVACDSATVSVDGFVICRDSRYAIQPNTKTPKIRLAHNDHFL